MKEYRTFYGSTSSNTLAFCHKHKLSLTPKQLKQKQCMRKQCNALQKFEHAYWDKQDEKKQMRKERKQKQEEKYMEAIHSAH